MKKLTLFYENFETTFFIRSRSRAQYRFSTTNMDDPIFEFLIAYPKIFMFKRPLRKYEPRRINTFNE